MRCKKCVVKKGDSLCDECNKTATVSDSPGLPGYVPKQEHDKVCKNLADAQDLLQRLYDCGGLDARREEMVEEFLGLST